ncbi:outer membrane beta-barrel family protein [Actinomadura fibrosa]
MPFSGIAQHNLDGRIIDSNNDPIAFANVILLSAKDSTTVYKGAVSTENGEFRFTNIEEKPYVIKVSFVGYKDYLALIEDPTKEKLSPVVLKESSEDLGEVSINYKKPTVRKQVDRLVFTVENSSLSSGSTWEILKKTPGVIVANNSLQVRNQGVQVYINDRKVQLSSSELQTLLENYSGENIRSVEVITNPPARYDAEGGAILNIVTSKTIIPGYKGNVNGAYTQAIYPKYTLGTSHYLKNEKLNLFANYSFSPRKEFKDDDSYINFRNAGNVISRWETDFDRTTESNAHNANLILDYDLDNKNRLSFSTYTTFSPDRTFNNVVLTNIEDQLPSTPDYFITNSGLEEDVKNIAMDLEFRHQLNDVGAQISAKGHYTRFDKDRMQDVKTTNFDGGNTSSVNEFYTTAAQNINIYVGQLDYVTPLAGTNFETGIKASVIDSESGIDFFDVENGSSQPNTALSDNFLYDENIFAGYLSLTKDWEKWSIKVGLRGEYTDRTGESESMEQIDDREYFELFPTFFLQHMLSGGNSLTLDYSRRIARPRYESLNPFRYFLNEYDYNSGNPNLRAAISHNFNLNFTLKNEYFFDLYYRDNGGRPQTLSFQDNRALTIRRVSVNLLDSKSYGLDISHGRSLANWWYAYAYVSFFHEEETFLALESNNAEVTNDIDAFYGTIYNSFVLSKDGTLSGDLSLTYVSDWITGSYNFEPMTTLSFGFRKSLWNNRAEVTLHFEDVLDETNTWLRSNYLNQDNGFYAKPENRFVRVGFKYNFGNFRLQDNERSIEAAERERL